MCYIRCLFTGCVKSTLFYLKSTTKRKIYETIAKRNKTNSPYKYNTNNKITRNAIIINCNTGLYSNQLLINRANGERKPLSLAGMDSITSLESMQRACQNIFSVSALYFCCDYSGSHCSQRRRKRTFCFAKPLDGLASDSTTAKSPPPTNPIAIKQQKGNLDNTKKKW